MCCAKHFAGNEQETFRRGSNKLRCDAVDTLATPPGPCGSCTCAPFEMAVRGRGPALRHDLLQQDQRHLRRGQPGPVHRQSSGRSGASDGLVVTDWGDMDQVVDGADAVAAGNDVIMPGGPPVAEQILRGLEEGRVSREDLERSVRRLLGLLRRVDRDRL